MFCPGCGTQNDLNHRYCRQCGQALSDVHLAVIGNTDQSLERLKNSQEWINAGSGTIVVFTLIGVALTILGFSINEPVLINIALINMILGSIIGIPLVYLGRVNLKRAARLLSKREGEANHSSLNQKQEPETLLTSGLDSESNRMLNPVSVTEHTTQNLQDREPT